MNTTLLNSSLLSIGFVKFLYELDNGLSFTLYKGWCGGGGGVVLVVLEVVLLVPVLILSR